MKSNLFQELQAMYMEVISVEMFFEAGPNLIGELLRTRQSVVANDVMTDARKNALPAGHPNIDRFIGLPLMRGKAILTNWHLLKPARMLI